LNYYKITATALTEKITAVDEKNNGKINQVFLNLPQL